MPTVDWHPGREVETPITPKLAGMDCPPSPFGRFWLKGLGMLGKAHFIFSFDGASTISIERLSKVAPRDRKYSQRSVVTVRQPIPDLVPGPAYWLNLKKTLQPGAMNRERSFMKYCQSSRPHWPSKPALSKHVAKAVIKSNGPPGISGSGCLGWMRCSTFLSPRRSVTALR